MAAGADAGFYECEELFGIVEAVDEVAGEDEVVIGEFCGQVTGVALHEVYAVFDGGVVGEVLEFDFFVGYEVTFVLDCVALAASFLQPCWRFDQAGGEVECVDMGVGFGQLKRGASGGAAEVEGAFVPCICGEFFARGVDTGDGEILDAEIFSAVVEFDIFGDHFIGFVDVHIGVGEGVSLDVAEAGILEKVTAEGVAGVFEGVVSG